MAVNHPDIDLRDHDALVKQLNDYLSGADQKGWGVDGDRKAGALMHIFARMMETLITRLNQVPDKTFLAFLDKLGISPAPARPARTALVFSLVKKSPVSYTEVPAGTQVAAEKSPDKDPLVFETERSLTVIAPALVRAVSLCGSDDSYTDHSALFSEKGSNSVETLFTGKTAIPHKLYIGDNILLNYKKTKNISIELIPETNPEIDALVKFYAGGEVDADNHYKPIVKWFYVDKDGSEKTLALSKGIATNPIIEENPSRLRFTFDAIEAPAEVTISGFEKTASGMKSNSWTSRWIGMELSKQFRKSNDGTMKVNELPVPPIYSINACAADGAKITMQSPDAGFYEGFAIDFTKDFRPFGERPRRFDTFYFGSMEVLSKAGSDVSITVNFSDGIIPLNDDQKLILKWEFWDGNGWMELGQSSPDKESVWPPSGNNNSYNFSDETKAFTCTNIETGSSEISKRPPKIRIGNCPAIQKCKVNGVENYWIRVRILAGGYGKDATYGTKNTPVEFVDTATGVKVTTNITVPDYIAHTYKAPSIACMSMQCTPAATAVQNLLAFNNFSYELLPNVVKSAVQPADSKLKIRPFIPEERLADTLYLAFNNSIAGLPVTLFFPLSAQGLIPASDDSTPPVLKWEYFNGTKWSALTVEDRTNELTRREMVVFNVPADCTTVPFYSEQLHWIRITKDDGKFPFQPSLSGIYVNSVWAHNRVTLSNILLDSSTGIPGLTVKLPYGSVIAGQSISVREDAITDKERRAIIDESGPDAIYEKFDPAGNILERWIRWKEVPHFYFANPGSRCYIIDRVNGTITFGNSKQGMIPPAGKNNIRCDHYQYGGGLRGNVKKNTISKLRTAIPYIDKITNPVPGEGGIDQETTDQLILRGPRLIKTRDRAVTASDFEWIAHEASHQIARVKCLPVTSQLKEFKPGHVAIMIIPSSDENKPLPTAELIDEVRNYVLERTSAHIAEPVPCPVHVMAPNYIRVTVTPTVHVKSLGEAKIVENRIHQALRKFLHPLTGGPSKTGWEFGRCVYESELYQLIEMVEGVDYVESITIDSTAAAYDIGISKEKQFVADYMFPSHSRLIFQDGAIVMILAEAIHKNEQVSSVTALGFMEGDQIQIYNMIENATELEKGPGIFLTIKSVQGLAGDKKSAVLECITAKSDYSFSENAIVETSRKPVDRRVRSYLTKAISAGEITTVTIAVPEMNNSFTCEHHDWPSYQKKAIVSSVKLEQGTVYFEEDCLPYSGEHVVITGPQTVTGNDQSAGSENSTSEIDGTITDTGYRYLVNTRTGEVHDLSNTYPTCCLDRIPLKYQRKVNMLSEIQKDLDKNIYDRCAWCFGPRQSKR